MAIIFVDSTATGTDDGSSWTNAYPSLNTAISAANHAPGDQYLVSGTFLETVTIAEVAARTTPTIIQGDDKSGGAGVGNPAQFTIDAESTRANCIDESLGSVQIFYVFKNMTCQNATGVGIFIGIQIDNLTLVDCIITANGSWGVQIDNYIACQGCEFSLNTAGGGLDADLGVYVIGCLFQANTGEGVETTSSATVVAFSVFDSNSGDSIYSGIAVGAAVINCTIDGDAKDTTNGIRFFSSSADLQMVINTIVYDCATGIRAGTDMGEMALSRNNLLNGNTTAYVSYATHAGEVTGAPAFESEGTDYTPGSSSPALEAGYDGGEIVGDGSTYIDIGAIQREPPAGGGSGGILIHPGTTGGASA